MKITEIIETLEEILDDDVIVRYEKGDIVGITILNAKKEKF